MADISLEKAEEEEQKARPRFLDTTALRQQPNSTSSYQKWCLPDAAVSWFPLRLTDPSDGTESEPIGAGAGRSLNHSLLKTILIVTCSGCRSSLGGFRYPVSEREWGVGRRDRAGQTDLSRSRLRRKLRVDE